MAERSSDSLLNTASLMILSLGSICFGKDRFATNYMADGLRMAERLHLLGENRHSVEQMGSLSRDEVAMAKFVAWGAFNCST